MSKYLPSCLQQHVGSVQRTVKRVPPAALHTAQHHPRVFAQHGTTIAGFVVYGLPCWVHGGSHELATASTASTYPTFESRDTFLAYVERTGTRFLDLGASRGGSRQRLLSYVRRAESSATPSAVLGLDISDEKLRACNADGKVNCAKADLQEIFKKGAAPVVEGAQMVDILEHINVPVPAVRAAAIPPARRRILHAGSFDTARHAAAVHLWRASCTAATGFSANHFLYTT